MFNEQFAALTIVNIVVRKGSKSGWYSQKAKKQRRKVMVVMKTGPFQTNASQSYLGRDLRGLTFQLKG